MINRMTMACLCLGGGLYGCSAPGVGENAEPISSTSDAIILPATGATSATPESGTLLPVSAARAASITPPLGTGFGTPIVNVPGLANVSIFFPPDTVGDVGTNHYIQATNTAPGTNGSLFTIFDKAGTPVSPEVTAVPLGQLVATETACSNAAGDPIVNYDREADRWIMLQFAARATGNHLCIYVSGDEPEALDEWQLYHFDLSTLVDAMGNPSRNGFPDYPKLSVWHDAYYITTNDQVVQGVDQDAAVYAIERAAMLAGTTARMQRFALPQDMSFIFQPGLAADWDSALPPPAGTPGLVIRRVDEELNRPGTGSALQDQLELWEVNVDFDDQTNSALDGPTVITTEDFDINTCALSGFCVTQPEGAPNLQTLSVNVMMWRLQYRNFGDHEALVGNFDVDGDGAGTAAPHWYELRRTGGAAWLLNQEDTLSIDDNHRWMGSIAMDGDGNMALGYSISSTTVYPGIRYTGRRATDPLGSMTEAEGTIVDGVGVQTGSTGFGGRWGDYSALTVDPVDDCTFWYTTEHYPVTSSVGWFTQIASFRFPDCGAGPPVCILGENDVDLRDRVIATADLAAGDHLEIGAPATLNGDGLVGGNALIRSNGVVNGDLTLGGTLSTEGPFTVSGTLTENASPSIPVLTTKTFATGSGSQVIESNVTLTPGNFGNVVVRSGRTVTLNAGVYNFLSLNVETDVDLVVNGAVEINVQGDFQFGDRSEVIGGTELTVYTNGSLVRIGTDVTFNGVLSAPNASVTVFSRTDIVGCIGGENVTFDTDVTLDSGGRSLPTSAPAAATCSDGIQNGDETGVDCGGPDCAPCPTGTLTAVAAVQSDWGAGYCAALQVTNASTLPTTNWNLTVDLNGSVITGSWNGTFSSSTGVINVAPAAEWNRVIAPGATNNTVGFCANRPPGAGTASVTSATGSF
jgi:hypothetical protein